MRKIIGSVFAIAVWLSSSAVLADGVTYNPSNNQLLIPSIVVGNTTYTNVVVTVGSIVSIGGSSPANTVLTVPFRTAMSNAVKNGFSKTYMVEGWIDNSTTRNPQPRTPINGSGTLTVGSPQSVKFIAGPLTGTNALASTIIMTGTATGASTETRYYDTSSFSLIAAQAPAISGTFYFTPYSIPLSVKAGDTGSLGNGTTGGIFADTISSFYSVSADTTSSLLITIMDKLEGTGTTTTQTVYRVDASGNVTVVSGTQSKSLLGSVYQVLNFTYNK